MSIDDDIIAVAGTPDVWYDANDLSGTYADGDTVTSWAAKAGSTALSINTGTPIFKANAGDTFPAVLMNAATMLGYAFASGWNAGFTIIMVTRILGDTDNTANIGQASCFFAGSTGTEVALGYIDAASFANGNTWAFVGGHDVIGGGGHADGITNQIRALSFDGSGGRVATEYVASNFSLSASVTLTGQLTVGIGAGGFAYAWPSLYREILIYKGRQADVDVDAICALLKTKWGRDIAPVVIWDGDSLSNAMMGFTESLSSEPGLLRLGRCYQVNVPGSTISDQISRFAANVQPKLQGPPTVANIILFDCGTNDLVLNSATAADTLTAYQSYESTAVAAGVSVGSPVQLIAKTVPPRGDATAPQITQIAAFNALIAANFTYIADWAADPVMGNPANNSNPTYYNVDTIHPANPAGILIFAGIDGAELNVLLDVLEPTTPPVNVVSVSFVDPSASPGSNLPADAYFQWFFDTPIDTVSGLPDGMYVVSDGTPNNKSPVAYRLAQGYGIQLNYGVAASPGVDTWVDTASAITNITFVGGGALADGTQSVNIAVAVVSVAPNLADFPDGSVLDFIFTDDGQQSGGAITDIQASEDNSTWVDATDVSQNDPDTQVFTATFPAPTVRYLYWRIIGLKNIVWDTLGTVADASGTITNPSPPDPFGSHRIIAATTFSDKVFAPGTYSPLIYT